MKAKSCLFVGVSQTITHKMPKSIWDYLKKEYARDERISGIQVMNLMHEFGLQKLKESEMIKGFSDKPLSIANKVKLFGTKFFYSRVVEKLLVTVPEKYEASIITS